MRLILGVLFIPWIIGGLSAQAQPVSIPLIAAIPEGVAAPMLFVAKDGTPSGIVPDISKAIAKELGRDVKLLLFSHYRLHDTLSTGRADMLCFANPLWGKTPDTYLWSKPLFVKKEVILGPAPAPKQLHEFRGKTIGTVLNYSYPKLDKQFASKEIIREDASSETANLLKLQKGRLLYAITDEVMLDYFKQTHPEIEKNRQRYSLQDYAISCNVSRKSALKIQDLNNAIDRLRVSGRFEQIFKNYGAKYEAF